MRFETVCVAVERILLGLVLAGLLFMSSPVRLSALQAFVLPVYLMAAVGLPLLWLGRAWHSATALSIDGFDLALMVCGAWMGLSTALGGPLSVQSFLVWESGLVLALYMRRSFRALGGFHLLLAAAVGLLAIEVTVSVLQFYPALGAALLPDSFSELFGNRRPERFMVGGRGLRLNRATGTFWAANVLGAWIVMWLPILLAGWVQLRPARRRWRWSIGALAAAGFGVLVRNLARVALAAGIVSTAFFGAVSWLRAGGTAAAAKRFLLGRRALAVAAAVAVLVGGYCLSTPGRQFVRVVLGKVEQSRGVAQVRLSLQMDAAAKVSRYLVIGAGHGRNRELMSPFRDIVEGMDDDVEQMHRGYAGKRLRAHNLYLMMTLDGGLPATICYVVALLWCFVLYARRFRTLGPIQDALATIAVGFAVMSLAYNIAYLDVWPLFMILFGSFRGALDREFERGEP